jgi:transcriptional regulator with XRE-family HTH domain
MGNSQRAAGRPVGPPWHASRRKQEQSDGSQDPWMGATTRALDRAARLADRRVREIGDEFRERRLMLSVSQGHVASAARLSRTRYGLIERGRSTALTFDELHRVAAVLGLSPSCRLFPDGPPVRDVAHATRLASFLADVQPPLAHRIEVPLPLVEGRAERRAWDAVLFAGPGRCAVELEMRLRDVQALLRRIDLKRRDDPTESFLLLVARTRNNRLILAEFRGLFTDLPLLRPGLARAALAEGRLPPTGILLV